MTVKLSELRPGQQGRIECVRGADNVCKRLLDMGVAPGAHVALRLVAAFGDPIEVEVGGDHVCLRKEEACRVAVVVP